MNKEPNTYVQFAMILDDKNPFHVLRVDTIERWINYSNIAYIIVIIALMVF